MTARGLPINSGRVHGICYSLFHQRSGKCACGVQICAHFELLVPHGDGIDGVSVSSGKDGINAAGQSGRTVALP